MVRVVGKEGAFGGGAEVNWSYGMDGQKYSEVISTAW